MNLLILIIVLLLFLYNLSGSTLIFPFLLCIINIIVSTLFMIINPDSYILRIIMLLSLALIIIIILVHIKLLFSYFF
jgi:hypothetical protein